MPEYLFPIPPVKRDETWFTTVKEEFCNDFIHAIYAHECSVGVVSPIRPHYVVNVCYTFRASDCPLMVTVYSSCTKDYRLLDTARGYARRWKEKAAHDIDSCTLTPAQTLLQLPKPIIAWSAAIGAAQNFWDIGDTILIDTCTDGNATTIMITQDRTALRSAPVDLNAKAAGNG